MNKRYYLRIYDDQGFSFICDSISEERDNIKEIRDADILITDMDYERYLNGVSSEKAFRLKSTLPNSGELFDFIEEYTPEPPRPSQEELNAQAIEEIIAMLMKE